MSLLIFADHVWRGESGRGYRFRVTLTDRGLPDRPGLYVFVRRRFVFFLQPLYVGKAASLRGRLIGHERWMEAWWQRGATERHVLVMEGAKARARAEEDLIRALKPPMNAMLVPRSRTDAPVDRKLRLRWTLRNWWRFLPGL